MLLAEEGALDSQEALGATLSIRPSVTTHTVTLMYGDGGMSTNWDL